MTDTDIKHEYEDEIELMDILLVIWRWKTFIIVSTTLAVIAALVFLFLSKNIYRVSMVIEPNTLEHKTYIDLPKNIEGLINSGVLNDKIITKSGVEGTSPVGFSFDVDRLKLTNKLKVSLDSSSTDKAIAILKSLRLVLNEQYQEIVDHNIEVQKKKLIDINKMFLARTNVQSEIKEINLNIAEIKEKIKEIKQQSETFLSQQTTLADGLSDQPMTENMLLFDRKLDVESSLNSYLSLLYHMESDKREKQREVDSGKFELQGLNYKRLQIQNMVNRAKLIQTNNDAILLVTPPKVLSSPVKPRTRLVLALAIIAGFMISFVSAFFLEYIRNFKNRISETERRA